MSRDPARRRYGRFFGADPRRDVDDEIAFHFAMRVEEFERAGMTHTQAEDAAMSRFGKVEQIRDECRELGQRRQARNRRAFRFEALRQDLRFAIRTLFVNRAFSAIVALTMALGIGANTAVFSVVYGVLLRPLPYADADALLRLWSRNQARGLDFFSVSPADFLDWRAQNRVFSAMAAFDRAHDAPVSRRSGEPQLISVTNVTPDIFALLGASAVHGRTLGAVDADPGAPPVALISHALWTTVFGSDSVMLGSDLTVDGKRYTVVGIMPPRFSVPASPADIWIPLPLAGSTDHGTRYLRVLARLRPGATMEGARSQLDAIAARLAQTYPTSNTSWSVNMMSVSENIVGTSFRRSLTILIGVVAFVLLIACANAANLQLARAATRRREIAVRTALGASRRRITAQLLTESALLGLIAGAAGLALARAGIALLRIVGATSIPRLDEVRLDTPVLLFTVVVALGSGLLFGLLPALSASRTNLGEVLKEGGRGEVGGVVGRGVRASLVIAEVSLSLVLLVGAGLLMRSFARLQSVDIGFRPATVAVVPFRLPESAFPDTGSVSSFFARVLERVRQIPGVTDAAGVSSAPFAGANSGTVLLPEGMPLPTREQPPDADYRSITPGYLHTMGIALERGRDFTAEDRGGAPRTMLISETMVRRYWPSEDPIGKRVRIGDLVNGPLYTIVGIVGDVRYQALETPDVRPMMYFSALASAPRGLAIVTRGVSAVTLTAALRQIVPAMDRRLPTPTVSDMEQLIGMAMATRRFALVLFGVFAGVALLLAAVGIYGVMSYLVRQRTRELGIRVALGAPARTLVASVVARAMSLALLGVILGLAGAWMLTRSLSSLLFEVSATDPAVFGGIAALLLVVALIASLLPARRATRADPLLALRGET